MMAEYIEREATVKLLRSLGSRDYRREKGTIQEAIKMVSFPEYTPPADVAPVRHGRWLTWEEQFPGSTPKKQSGLGVFCDKCHSHADNRTDYCPNCGAKMDEEVSE